MTEGSEGYRLLREGSAIVPIARDFVRLGGPDAVSFLQGQCTQDISLIEIGGTADALLLEPQGRINSLLRVTRTSSEEFVLDTDAGFGEAMLARLERFRLRVKVDITSLDWRCVSVRGPEANEVSCADSAVPGILKLSVEWPGIAGFDLIGSDPVAPSGVGLSGAAAWSAARIGSGIPMMGSEIDEKTIPAEAGLVDRCVSFTKGCFTGQELVARLDSRGSNVARRLCGLVSSGSELAVGADLVSDAGKTVGWITSSAWSFSFEAPVALAYVHRSVEAPGHVSVDGSEVEVRGLPLRS